MIPAQAVEAAAKAAYIQHSNEPGFNAAAAWDDMAGTDDWERGQWESTARAALEAAAPHMLAAAFDEAADAWAEAASWSDSQPSPEQVQRWLRSRANTYRTPDAR